MSKKLGLLSAVVVVSMVGCGVEMEEDGASAVAQKREAITFTGTAGTGLTDVATGGKQQGSWGYARRISDNRLLLINKNYPQSWGVHQYFTDTFQGKVGAAVLPDNCDVLAARRSDGTLGYQYFFWAGELDCFPFAYTFSSIPGSPSVTGSPAVSAWYSGSVQRVDVFVRNSSNQVASVTATGTSVASLSWGSWSTDTGITMLAGSDPAAISPTPGRIDLVACDSAGQLRQKTYSGGAWGSWNTITTGCSSSPSITGRTYKVFNKTYIELAVVVRDSGGQLKSIAYDQLGGWGSWNFLGGTFSGSAAVHYNASGSRRAWGYHTGLGGMAFGDF